MVSPGSWSGSFGYPDTEDLLGLNDHFFSIDRFREKRWCYMGIIHPDIIFGCAVVHLGYLASAFAFGFDRRLKKMMNHSLVFPPIGQVRYDKNPETGICRYTGLRGRLTLALHQNPAPHKLKVCFYLPGKSLKADMEIRAPQTGISPMHFLMPMNSNRSAFTCKASGLKASGNIQLNKKTFDLSSKNTFAIFDWTHGCFPRQTFWNWASGAGFADDGKQIGLNFSSGVYENGVRENSVWVNGKPLELGDITFTYDKKNPERPWQVKSLDGSVNLTFKPEGLRSANDNLWVIKSRFKQFCGSFEGTINTTDNNCITLSSVGGVVEEHFAKW